MRAAFGLVSLLVTLGIIALLMRVYVLPIAAQGTGKEGTLRAQAQQIAGVDSDGVRVQDSINLEPTSDASGKFAGEYVRSVYVGGPMDAFFGVVAGDRIVGVVVNGVQEMARDASDQAMFEAQVMEARGRNGQLLVERGGKRITLPDERATPAPATKPIPMVAPPGGNPAAGPTVPGATPDSLKKQLNGIQVPSH
jgi:hypothetical protein